MTTTKRATKPKSMKLEDALQILDALPVEPPGDDGWHAVAECARKLGLLTAWPRADRWAMSQAQYDKLTTDLRARIGCALELVPEGQREALQVALQVAGDEISDLEQSDSDLLNELANAVTRGARSDARGWFRNEIERRQREVAAVRAQVAAVSGARSA